MTTIRCKERMRNERRMRKRWPNNKATGPLVENLDRPGEMIRKTTQNGITTIKYNDKAHGGSPVTFIIKRRKKKTSSKENNARRISENKMGITE